MALKDIADFNGQPLTRYYAGIADDGVLVAVLPHTRTNVRDQGLERVEYAKADLGESRNPVRKIVLVKSTENFEIEDA